MASTIRIAADIGGTFTDIALIDESGAVITRKVASTPGDYAAGVVAGIGALLGDLGVPAAAVEEVLHGCTVASNAILEGTGAKTALITTRGFRDVLELRRIRIPALYDPLYVKPRPLVERDLRFEVTERVGADGAVVTPFDEADARTAVAAVRSAGVESVAVTFLHSYANPTHERRLGEMLREALPQAFVSLSVDVLPEIREYERTSTTVINAYVGPPVRRYLASLVERLAGAGVPGRLRVMQSSGGILDARRVMDMPAQIVECGPAAGVIGSLEVARRSGYANVISFDMGGTTAKASIIENGALARTGEYEVGGGISVSSQLIKGGGYPLKLPVIDISEVGAGGGSIVWLDKAGSLKVGPRSAGAVPGPACYDAGGADATVTDANVVLGFLNPVALAGGAVPLNPAKAHTAIEEGVAHPLGLTLESAAWGVRTIAIANMMRAVKAVTTYRGRDPRDFVLFAFGGNGGIHAVDMARELEIERVVVPLAAGVFSALGLLLSEIELGQARAYLRLVAEIDPADLESAFQALEADVVAGMDYPLQRVTLRRAADLRFAGQAFELTVPLPREGPVDRAGLCALAASFEAEHERTYGHRFGGDDPVELVSLRVSGRVSPTGRRQVDAARTLARGDGAGMAEGRRPAYFGPRFGTVGTAVIGRAALAAAARRGPLIVEDREATTVVPPDCRAALDSLGNIVIDVPPPGREVAP